MSLTQRDVEIWMVAAERADPRVRNPGEARPLTWPERFVEDLDQRRAVKLWVWCQANGYSFHDVASRRLGSYTTALRRKNRAVERITMLLALEESLKDTGSLVAALD